MPSLKLSKGFSTLQSVSTLLIFAATTGAALQMMPEVLDNADQVAARYAASSETMHKEVWDEYTKAMGGRPEQSDGMPQPIRHNLEVRDGQVMSPLGGYCFSEANPGEAITSCPESLKDKQKILQIAGE